METYFKIKLIEEYAGLIIMGIVSKSKVTSESEENMFITFIWSCTNFLVPKTNG